PNVCLCFQSSVSSPESAPHYQRHSPLAGSSLPPLVASPSPRRFPCVSYTQVCVPDDGAIPIGESGPVPSAHNSLARWLSNTLPLLSATGVITFATDSDHTTSD